MLLAQPGHISARAIKRASEKCDLQLLFATVNQENKEFAPSNMHDDARKVFVF